MSLVSYDYGSDSEDSDVELQSVPQRNEIEKSDSETKNCNLNTTTQGISSIFHNLPSKKKSTITIAEDEVEDFIPKAVVKPRKKVQISIPALSDFDDIADEPEIKKIKPSSKGSSLISMLPPVKSIPLSNKSFVPNILMNKNKVINEEVKKNSKPIIPQIVMKKKVSKEKTEIKNDDSDDDLELPETFDEELWLKSCGKVLKKDIVEETPIVVEQIINSAPEAIQPYEGLDNKAFKELVGKSNRMPLNFKMIDINEEALVAEDDLWITKSLTDPSFVPKKEIENPVDNTKKKKHHITYLAQQAKANEEDFKNQWAASKFSRNQTRSKYGF